MYVFKSSALEWLSTYILNVIPSIREEWIIQFSKYVLPSKNFIIPCVPSLVKDKMGRAKKLYAWMRAVECGLICLESEPFKNNHAISKSGGWRRAAHVASLEEDVSG